ncbi:MAG: long-chain fatty acid--CoA ligase [Chlorobi bacterium]|nr:long-chain fatty acid--CoA ligase [Chlorobiota bacterium]
MGEYSNFSEFFEFITGLYGSSPALFWKENDKYESLSGKKLKELVYLASKSLEKFNLKAGDKAAIISETRFEWVVSDFACISKGIVTVPIYTTMTSEQIKFILEHSECKLCFVSSMLIADKVSAVIDELPKLKKIVSFNRIDGKSGQIISFEELIYSKLIHNKPYNEEDTDNYFAECSKNHKPDDLLTIIYTSGTTGTPKGVCLSHRNILINIEQSLSAISVNKNDIVLSFLPLAHTYERTAGYYLKLSRGVKIYYAQSIDTLQVQMQEVKPTVILAVPILFSRIQGRIMKNINSMSAVKKLIAKRALKIGRKYMNNKNHFLWKLADKKVFSTIRERTGGRLRLIVSGGSALSKELAEFFDSIGMPIMQGYGMTEASPVISVNKPGKNKYGTVGPPLTGVEVKTANDGEILVKGDNVMLGYYKNEQATAEMIIDGWLHTGDIGEIDSDGFIKITDRKKTLIKTSGGKYISLTHIEDTLARSEFIEQIITFASDERHFVSALIVPNFEKLTEFAEKVDVKYSNPGELVENDVINNFYESEIDVLQRPLAKYERVRKFVLMDKPFTIESGELTPTLKLKRRIIEERYKDIIDGFYK